METCLGLPLTEIAPFTAEECGAVERRFQTLRTRGMSGLMTLVVSLGAGSVFGIMMLRFSDRTPVATLGAVLYVGVLIGFARAFLILKDVTAETVGLVRDRRRAQVFVFRGQSVARAETQRRALAIVLGREEPTHETTTELRVLPHTQLLIRPGGDGLEFVRVLIHRTASPSRNG